MQRIIILALGALMMLASPAPIAAQDEAISPTEQARLITKLEQSLRQHYVYSDRVDTIIQELRQRAQANEYRSAISVTAFAELLTNDLIATTGDLHFLVAASPLAADEADNESLFEIDDLEAAQRSNFGIRRLETMPGNIGYFRLDHFPNPEQAYDALSGAMRFLENADALILDMRYNQGGYLEAAQFIASHLFSGDKDQVLFRYFYNQDGQRIERGQWVLSALPAKRRPDMPVYVLTGATTFSAGEWIAVSLQELGRAQLVGQTTSGAGHPIERFRLDPSFIVQVPVGKIFAPVSGGDFEGTGVRPDHEVPSHRALTSAYAMALEATMTADDPTKRALLDQARMAHLSPQAIERAQQAIVGSYEGRTVTLESGTLIYRWRDRFTLALFPIGDDRYSVEGTDEYVFRIVRNAGQTTALIREMREGGSHSYARID